MCLERYISCHNHALQALELVKHAERQGFKIPKAIASVALHFVRNSIKKRAKFDIYDVKPIKRAAESFIPAFFIAAEADEMIDPHHSHDLHEVYGGDKNISTFEGALLFLLWLLLLFLLLLLLFTWHSKEECQSCVRWRMSRSVTAHAVASSTIGFHSHCVVDWYLRTRSTLLTATEIRSRLSHYLPFRTTVCWWFLTRRYHRPRWRRGTSGWW